MSTETDEFLAEMLPRQRAAEQAIHNGDVEPRLALWSRTDPVTAVRREDCPVPVGPSSSGCSATSRHGSPTPRSTTSR